MSRACDKCFSLKTQCDGQDPCSRCNRLELSCLRTRPVRQRGRPRLYNSRKRASDIPATSPLEQCRPVHDRGHISQPLPGMPLDPDTRHDSPSTERHLTQQTDDGTSTDGVSRDGNFSEDVNLPETTESVTSAQSAHLDEPYEERDPWNLEHSVAVSIGLDQPGIPVTPRSRDMDTDTEQVNTADTLKYGIDRDGAVMLLEYMLSSGPKLGIFSLLHDLHFDIKSAIQHLGGSRARQGCAGLAYAVLAIALEIYPYQSHQHLALNTDIAIDSLRAEFLSLIPTLAWKSADADISPCVSLLFASYTWCFKGNLTEISARWIGIARLLWEELRSGEVPDWSTQFRNRITNAIHFQSILMSYLHFQEPPLPLSLQHDDTSCHSSSEGDEYFHLLSQLVGPFQQACKLDRQPANLRRVRDDLEEVYLGLPPHLLEFSDLEYAYQAEFLLWLHGIYIITYVNPDLYTVFTDSSLPLTREYFSTLEHTLLLGEVLPSLLLLDPQGQTISAGTIMFVLLSSMVLSTALVQFNNVRLSAEVELQDIPNALHSCAKSHIEALEPLLRPNHRLNNELIHAVHNVLKALSSPVTSFQEQIIQENLQIIAQYRWTRGGTGIRKVPNGASLSYPQQGTLYSLPSSGFFATVMETERLETVREAIKTLCSPHARIARPNCFDLYIQS